LPTCSNPTNDVDPNFIGSFAHVKVLVAEGVDRNHGINAFNMFLEFYESGYFTVENLNGMAPIKITKIVITGAPTESNIVNAPNSVSHSGNGVLHGHIETWDELTAIRAWRFIYNGLSLITNEIIGDWGDLWG